MRDYLIGVCCGLLLAVLWLLMPAQREKPEEAAARQAQEAKQSVEDTLRQIDAILAQP